jgi:hypothetical protein
MYICIHIYIYLYIYIYINTFSRSSLRKLRPPSLTQDFSLGIDVLPVSIPECLSLIDILPSSPMLVSNLCTRLFILASFSLFFRAYICICMDVYIYIYTLSNICINIYMYICIYLHRYIYTYM